MAETLTRNFKVIGNVTGSFDPTGTSPESKILQGIVVELWHKSPLDAVFLGNGVTDEAGDFVVEFKLESPSPIIVDGQINEVFLKFYYQGVLIDGENPYTT